MKRFWMLILFNVLAYPFFSQDISANLMPICSSVGIDAHIPIETGIMGIYAPCPGQGFSTTYLDFYKVIIASGTTFTFAISPSGELDYDFISWKNPESIYDLGPGDRGSLNNPYQLDVPTFDIGLSLTATDICEPINSQGYPEPGFVQHYNVQEGDVVIIAVNMYGPGASGYNLTFGGDAVLSCDLSYNICDGDHDGFGEFSLGDIKDDIENFVYAEQNFSVAFYNSYEHAESGGSVGLLQTNYSAPLGTNSAIIYGRIEDQFGILNRVVDIYLTVYPTPQVQPLPYYAQCDANGDGVEIINLNPIIPLVIGNQTGLDCKFYLSQNTAEQGNNSFIVNTTGYFTSGNTVYLRVENNDRCYKVVPIEIVIVQMDIPPVALVSEPICDTDLDGFGSFNLYDYIVDLNLDAYYNVSFYESATAADEGGSNGLITSPEDYELAAGTEQNIYARIAISGCFQVVDFQISVYNPPELNLDDTLVETCLNSRAILTATGNADTFNWYGSSDLGALLYSGKAFETPPITATTTYWCQSVSTNGCLSNPKSVTINVIWDSLQLEITNDTLVCQGEPVFLNVAVTHGIPPISIAWNTGGTGSGIHVEPYQSTLYGVTVTDGCGTVLSESVKVNVSTIKADFNSDIADFYDVTFTNRSIPGNNITSLWDFGDGKTATDFNVHHSYSEVKEFDVHLTVINEIGCIDTLTKTIKPPAQVYIPNTFTPNGDGVNDVFKVIAPDALKIELTIYNRWGQEVHHAVGKNVFWNGSYQNDNYFVATGEYIYRIVVHTNASPEIIQRQGVVNLIR